MTFTTFLRLRIDPVSVPSGVASETVPVVEHICNYRGDKASEQSNKNIRYE